MSSVLREVGRDVPPAAAALRSESGRDSLLAEVQRLLDVAASSTLEAAAARRLTERLLEELEACRASHAAQPSVSPAALEVVSESSEASGTPPDQIRLAAAHDACADLHCPRDWPEEWPELPSECESLREMVVVGRSYQLRASQR